MTDEVAQVGRILKQAREDAGISRAMMAKLTGYSYGYIANLENGGGGKVVHDYHVNAYQEALASKGTPMKRRSALILAALGSVIGTPLADDFIRAGLHDAIGVNDWPDVADEYGRLFMTLDGETFRRRLRGELIVITDVLRRNDSEHTSAAAARMLTLYGANMSPDESAKWYRTAKLTASGQPTLTNWISGREAFRASYEGASSAGLLRLTKQSDSCEARLAEAHALARAGQTRAALSNLDDALRKHSSNDHSEDTIYALPPWRLSVATAYVYALIGNINQCERSLSEIQIPQGLTKWRLQAELVRAVAYRQSGDRVTAADLATHTVAPIGNDHGNMVLAHLFTEATQGVTV